jgi:4'-phosphopantetheinyl transferase
VTTRDESGEALVTVWSLVPTPALADVVGGQLLPILSREERERAARYRLLRDQQLSVAARALLRTALTWHAAEHGQAVAPADWRFATGRWGKPELVGPTAAGALVFNVAHTEGLVVCAVAAGVDLRGRVGTVGADVELRDRRSDYLGLAAHYFSPGEAARVAAAGKDGVAATFFGIWTLKEAYVKAHGGGLGHGLASFWFTATAPPRIVFAPPTAGADPDGSGWSFDQRSVGPHLVAVGAQVVAGAPAGFAFRPPGLPPA